MKKLNIVVVIVSDTRTDDTDKSGKKLKHLIENDGHVVIDKTIVKWGTVFNKKIPKSILKEVEKKAENLTYYHQWKRFDLIMLDNRRFMHARNFFSKKDRRQILNTQTLESNFN